MKITPAVPGRKTSLRARHPLRGRLSARLLKGSVMLSKLSERKQKSAAERICAFCRKPFTPRWHRTGPTNRKYCYRPKCELARERAYRAKRKQ